jgi:signal transduction histidine kinase/DNA-binding response OmpR family regulator
VTGERILVVDDSAKVRDFLSHSVLGMEGYIVDVAWDGVEGLASALTHNPDLIITDLAMPEMDGLEMVEELRQNDRQIPVILITGEGSEQIAVRALRAGVMDYFVKPFDEEDLRLAIKRILRSTRVGALRAGIPDQRRLQALNTLIAIGKSVTSLLDLELILTRVVEAAVYLSGAEEGVLMLVDQDSGELYVRVAKNLEDGLRSMRLQVKDSLAGRVVRSGEPLLISGQGMQKIKTQYLVRSLLYVPLKVGDQIIGVLGLYNRMTDRVISNQDVSLIKALADYAAIAIVNAQHYTEAETERSRFRRVFDQIQESTLLVDDDGRLTYANQAAWDTVLPAGVADPIGHYVANLIDNPALLDLMSMSGKKGHVQGEITLDDERSFNAHFNHIDGVGCAISLQEITNLKDLDRLKTDAIMTISHDLRSPLTAVLSYVDLITRVGDLNEQQAEFAEKVKTSVQVITNLISDLLQMGRLEAESAQQREVISVVEMTRYVVDAVRGRADMKGQDVIVELTEQDTTVLGTPSHLRRVLLNLVDNAIKYTPDGGEVEVSVFREADQVMVSISDTGIGIDAENLPHVFDKYYRVADVEETHEGSGLGLNIVKNIIEDHDGRIWVDSYPGEGTTFTIVLPLFQNSQGAV